MDINFLDTARQVFQSQKGINKFIQEEVKDSSIYVMGKNDNSAELIKNWRVLGVVDDFNPSGFWMDTPVVSSLNIGRQEIIVNCSTAIAPIDAHNSLKKKGFAKILKASELQALNMLPPPWFVTQQINEIQLYHNDWNELFKKMSDDESRKTLLDIVRYRLTGDYEYMQGYHVRISEQYFEDFMNFHNEFFVDAGGYDGDTSLEFIKRYPNYNKIYFFEPSGKNMRAAKANLGRLSNIEFKNLGLSDSPAVVRFNSENGSASSISTTGSEKIKLVRLDDELKDQPVTFIKMDLEGWELKALHGAAQIIKEQKPKLAIAVYHSAQDFRAISQFVLDLNPSYKLHLRHYTQGWAETIMFFS